MNKTAIYQLNSKLPLTGTTIFTVMSKMANKYGAINLSQGFPDFNAPQELLDRYKYYLDSGFNQYAPMQGIPRLRDKAAQKINELYGHQYNPSTEITITAGATQAIYTAITSVIHRGDEVIIFEPAYDSYAPSVILNGGNPVFIQLNPEDYSIPWQKVKSSITDRTKLIIINSPHNPTGSVINNADIKNLEEITRNRDIFILSDEVYEHIVYDNGIHVSLCSSRELAEKTFIISSFGKTYHATGWKTGYCAAPEYLMNEFNKIHQYLVFSVNTPAQYAIADYLDNREHYLSLGGFYQAKRDLLLAELKKSNFILKPSKGTYFQLLDYSKISELNDMQFAEHLTRDHGVAVIPLSPFYSGNTSNKTVRVCFAKKDEVLKTATDKLNRL